MIDEFEWERDMGVAPGMAGMSQRWVWKEPMGVVGAIVPWNFPFEVTINKIAQILATGNTCVLKPAPDTPWNATRLGRLVAEKTDMPAGVFNVVTSSDHLVGEELTLSPLVDMISFTGSTVTGQRIMEKGAATMKRVFLELGGKSANIILDDADFNSVVPMGTFACLHGGQGCALPTRMLLPRSRYDEGVAIISAAMAQFPWGDPYDPANMMGPLVSEKQLNRVLGYIQQGKDEGAKLVVGGNRPDQPGWWVEPTLFVDVDNSMTIAREEIFGPVLSVIPYDDDEDAIRIANESEYGLSGGVASADHDRAVAIARRIRTGSFAVNGGSWYAADMPYGGYKTSGVGRQNGIEGFEQYLETKIVAWPAAHERRDRPVGAHGARHRRRPGGRRRCRRAARRGGRTGRGERPRRRAGRGAGAGPARRRWRRDRGTVRRDRPRDGHRHRRRARPHRHPGEQRRATPVATRGPAWWRSPRPRRPTGRSSCRSTSTA